MTKLVSVKTFTTRTEADLAKGYLESHGIEAFATADDEGGMYPYPVAPTVNGAKVYVNEKDSKEASDLLKKVK